MYSHLGFERTFYGTAIILSIPLILQIIYIPNRLNNYKEEEEEEEDEIDGKKITFWTLLTN